MPFSLIPLGQLLSDFTYHTYVNFQSKVQRTGGRDTEQYDIIISLCFYIYQIYRLCFPPSFSGTHALYTQLNHFIFHRNITMKQTGFSFVMSTIYYAICTFCARRHLRRQVDLHF
jgi:hypothetical protein